MRCYNICNMYIGGIQAGIQSAHAQMELFVKYTNGGSEAIQLFDWARNHKTAILLNGGDYYDLCQLFLLLSLGSNEFPWASFKESGLNDVTTNISIILPERIYNTMALMNRFRRYKIFSFKDGKGFSFNETIVNERFTSFEIELMKTLKSMRLMT